VDRAVRGYSRWFAACVAAALAALCAGGARADAAAPAFGAYVPEFSHAYPANPKALDVFSGVVGRAPAIVSSYKQWPGSPVVSNEVSAVWDRGAVPMITWEPFNYEGATYPLRAIARGRYDGYLRRAAADAAAWGRPILIRFAHEMNGPFYPWGAGRGGNTPERYVDAWRHVVQTFRKQGAGNVRWVWAPQANTDGRYPLRPYFPGDRWVDWVALDGYAGFYGLQSFTEIFGSSYRTLTRLSARPVMISETGASETSGDKPAWIARTLGGELARFPRIRAVVWFNAPFDGHDFRIASSQPSLTAFRTEIASEANAGTRESVLRAPRRLRRR
jgi:hypothetical protein